MSTEVANDNEDDRDDDKESLRQLLAALAAGARSVSGLPTSSTTTGEEDDEDTTAMNQFAFESSFPEFTTALAQASTTLVETLTEAFASLQQGGNNKASATSTGNESDDDDDDDDDDEMMIDTTAAATASMMQDPLFWEQCADACDLLVNQVEAYLENNNNNQAASSTSTTTAIMQFKDWSAAARRQSEVSYGLLQQRLVDMEEKPQITYNITPPQAQNGRTAPFIPRVHPDKPHAIVPLDLTLQPGHGLETASFLQANSNSNNKKKYLPADLIAPSHHVPHPYATEIQQFSYQPWQLEKPSSTASTTTIPIVDKLTATWIDTPQALQEVSDKLQQIMAASNNSSDGARLPELAIDLEAHSFRSFAGLTCLMQLSYRENGSGKMQNYLIDTLKLHSHINGAFAEVLANPRVCKVLHGADSDIAWLQRDFGLYIVNLFDTGRAARALSLTGGASYGNLLRTYVFTSGQAIDKTHQLSDWRQRPLPADMQHYAIQDTHYLLDIAQHLRVQLHAQNLLKDVLDTSRKVCLIRYAGEPFKPSGYYSSIILGSSSKRRQGNVKVQTEWTPQQQVVCKALWDWRDATARRLDESCPYVLSNRLLGRLARSMPQTAQHVQNIVSSTTSTTNSTKNNGIMEQDLAQDVVQCIQQAIAQYEQEQANNNDDEDDEELDEEMPPASSSDAAAAVQSSSSAFFKPTSASKERQRRGMLSPVLGTEALYKQAGWMTPQEQELLAPPKLTAELAPTTSTSASDDGGDAEDDSKKSSKPRRLLSIQTSNKNYNAKRLGEHSLELAGGAAATTPSRGRTVDGMATVRAAREATSLSPTPQTAAVTAAMDDDDVKQARQSSADIRSGLQRGGPIPAVLGLISSAASTATTTTPTKAKGASSSDMEGDMHTKTTATSPGTEMEEEEFVIPRSMREIYKISNRNRRNKKAGSPTPERGVTPTSEKEREELAKAEALLKERGFEAAGYLFEHSNTSSGQQQSQLHTSGSSSPGKRAKTKSGRESEESVPQEATGGAAAREDLEFMRSIGWIGAQQSDESILAQRYASNNNTTRAESTGTTGTGGGGADDATSSTATTRPTSRAEEGSSNRPASSASNYDYSQVGPIGALQPPSAGATSTGSNPFFSGGGNTSGRSSTSPALQGGPLAQNLAKADGGASQQQQQQKSSRKNSGGNNSTKGGKQTNRNKQERPEKKDGRTHAYRSKR